MWHTGFSFRIIDMRAFTSDMSVCAFAVQVNKKEMQLFGNNSSRLPQLCKPDKVLPQEAFLYDPPLTTPVFGERAQDALEVMGVMPPPQVSAAHSLVEAALTRLEGALHVGFAVSLQHVQPHGLGFLFMQHQQ